MCLINKLYTRINFMFCDGKMMFGYKAGTQERAVSSPPARTLPAHTNDMYKDFYGGYHDGAVAADNDNSSGKGVDFHGCLAAGHSQEYCKGYEAGYNDEVRFYI